MDPTEPTFTEQVVTTLIMAGAILGMLGVFALIGRLTGARSNPVDDRPAPAPDPRRRAPERMPERMPAHADDALAAAVARSLQQQPPRLLAAARGMAPPPSPQARDLARDLAPVDFWERPRVQARDIAIGTDGEEWVGLDLDAQSHWAVIGTKGSGKGNTLILLAVSALALGPETAEVWIADPKDGVDYAHLCRCRHAKLFADVAQIGQDDLPILRSGVPVPEFDGMLSDGYDRVIREMQRRNRIIREAGWANRLEYNRATPDRPLPALLFIADEVADLTNEQHERLATIARMGRSAGIVLVVSTQYPTADVLSSQIQANLDHRVVLRVTSGKYVHVSLGIPPGQKPQYDPSQITERGVAVARMGERETLIRIPEVVAADRRAIADELAQRWPREAATAASSPALAPNHAPAPAAPALAPEADGISDDLLPALLALMEPTWNERQQRLALYLFAQLARGRTLDESDISMRELARVAYPQNQQGGGGGYLQLTREHLRKVLPGVEAWCARVHMGEVSAS